MMDEQNLTYISSWNWQIISWIFFSTSIILFAIPKTILTSVFSVVFFLLFIGCEYKSFKRREDFYNE